MINAVFRLAAIVVAGLLGVAGVATHARAAPLSFTVALSGAQQVPPVNTAGSGTAELTFDPSTRVVSWSVTYSGLSSPVTMAHFHGPAPAGVKSAADLVLGIRRRTRRQPERVRRLDATEFNR